MREFKSGEDFDILEDGSFSERTRHDDAVTSVRKDILKTNTGGRTDDMLRKGEEGPLALESTVEALGKVSA